MSPVTKGQVDEDTAVFEKATVGISKKDSSELSLSKIFDRYNKKTRQKKKIDSLDVVGIPGLMQFAVDLGIPVEDSFFLVLFEKLNCKKQYEIQRSEFVDGFKKLDLKNLDEIKGKIEEYRKELKDETRFSEIFMYSFRYHSSGGSSIPIDLAVLVWGCLFKNSYITISLDNLYEFCKKEFKIKDVNDENWQNVLIIADEESKMETVNKSNFEALVEKIGSKNKLLKGYLAYLKDNKKFK